MNRHSRNRLIDEIEAYLAFWAETDPRPIPTPEQTVKVHVSWDYGDEELSPGEWVPTYVDIPLSIYDEGYLESESGNDPVSDYLSDKYGWCVFDWYLVEKVRS